MKTFNTFVSEQILDELNKDTLYSYAKKSEADLNKKHKELASQVRANKPAEANKTSAKLSNRDKGLDRAEARLNKEAADDHYAESEAHLNKASKALETSDMAAHHFHMSNHHEAKGRWHEEKGRHSSADREYAKAEEHHEKSMKPNNSKSVGVKNEEVQQVNELSSDTLQSYKEKAKKSADELTAKGKHGKALDRTMFRMRATGKQIDKTTAGIKKALNKEDVDKGEYDYEGQMARGQLQTTLRNCKDLIDMIKDNENMPEWVQSKITLAQDYITTVRDYMQSKEELGEN